MIAKEITLYTPKISFRLSIWRLLIASSYLCSNLQLVDVEQNWFGGGISPFKDQAGTAAQNLFIGIIFLAECSMICFDQIHDSFVTCCSKSTNMSKWRCFVVTLKYFGWFPLKRIEIDFWHQIWPGIGVRVGWTERHLWRFQVGEKSKLVSFSGWTQNSSRWSKKITMYPIFLHLYLLPPESGQRSWQIKSRRVRGWKWRGWDFVATRQKPWAKANQPPSPFIPFFHPVSRASPFWLFQKFCCVGRVTGARATAALLKADNDKDEIVLRTEL